MFDVQVIKQEPIPCVAAKEEPLVYKSVVPKTETTNKFALPKGTNPLLLIKIYITSSLIGFWGVAMDHFHTKAASKGPEGISNQLLNGVMTIVMGVVTMVRMTRNMPKRLTDATLYSPSMYSESPRQDVRNEDYIMMMKRMNELEEKVNVLNRKPSAMPSDKEEMLDNALKRIDMLEQELSSTKKVLFY